jgi:hypothetical protein
MPERLPEYRARAADLRRQAARALPEHKAGFLKLAEQYEQLADQIEAMAVRKKNRRLAE